jgi:hypothetical protein
LALAEADGLDDGVDVLLLVPEVPVLELEGEVFRMNFESLDALVLPDAPVVPDVPVGLELELALDRSMHPVRVTLSAELELGVCDDGGGVVCAAAIVTVHAIAAHIPDHTLFVILSS